MGGRTTKMKNKLRMAIVIALVVAAFTGCELYQAVNVTWTIDRGIDGHRRYTRQLHRPEPRQDRSHGREPRDRRGHGGQRHATSTPRGLRTSASTRTRSSSDTSTSLTGGSPSACGDGAQRRHGQPLGLNRTSRGQPAWPSGPEPNGPRAFHAGSVDFSTPRSSYICDSRPTRRYRDAFHGHGQGDEGLRSGRPAHHGATRIDGEVQRGAGEGGRDARR